MGIAELADVTKIVSFDVIGQSVSGNSSWELVVPIGEGWQAAIVTLWARAGAHVTANAKRISACLFVSNDVNDAYSQAVIYEIHAAGSYQGITYWIPSYKYGGFSYATDARLCDPGFDSSGARARIESAQIDGSDLKITFYNTSSTGTILYLEGRIRLLRSKLL